MYAFVCGSLVYAHRDQSTNQTPVLFTILKKSPISWCNLHEAPPTLIFTENMSWKFSAFKILWQPDSMQRMATVVQTKFKWEKRCEPFLSGRHEQTVRRAKREAQAFPETCSQERWKWSWPWRTFEWRDQPTISSFLFIKCPGGVLRLPLQCLFPLLCPFIKNQVLKKKVLEKSQLVVED